jgi:ATP-dependent protease ClpP protease subunit
MADWSAILSEINAETQKRLNDARSASDTIRRRYLNKLYRLTGRNVIAYYSGFLTKPSVAETQVIDDDKNGFMMAVHKLDRSKGLDLFLHTPGGNIAVTESLVDYLPQMFGKDIRAIVPQIAMSAGTMIACSTKEIVMGKHSNLGPVDPQILGIPAAGVIEEFKRAWTEIKLDQSRMLVWQFVLSKYTPSYLGQCENAVKWATDFVTKALEANMFSEQDPQPRHALATTIVKHLTDFSNNKAHDRHIHFDECKAVGLNVKSLENDYPPEFQDAVLSVHHAFMNTLANTQSLKIIENHLGAAFVKQQMLIPANAQGLALQQI